MKLLLFCFNIQLPKLQNDRNDSSFLTFSKNIYARKKIC